MVDYLTELPLAGRMLNAATKNLAGTAMPSFVAGPENRLVASTVERLLQSAQEAKTPPAPHSSLSILALFGPSGVGKTHMVRGIVEHWKRELGDDAAHYVTAADFRRELADAIDHHTMPEFRAHYRQRRLLAIDDIHRLASSDAAMQELRSTLDEIEYAGRLLIVTADRPPAVLANLTSDIASRFASGLSLQLAPPSTAARLRIIRHAAGALGRPISDELANRLAESSMGTATQLFGTLFELTTPATSPTLPFSSTTTPASRKARRPPSLPEIIAVVCKHTSVPQKLLKSASRKQSIVYARSLAIYLARELSAASYEQIGRALGGRDHTTVMHSYQRIEERIAADYTTQETVASLRRILTNR